MLSEKFISIEGNIGSGKSTILKIIRQSFPELVILDEPLASWEKVGEKQNINLLGMYYDDPKRWGFTFQIYAFMTRLKKWTEFSRLDKDQAQIKISQRSLLSDRYVFASIMRDMDILNQAEYEIYLQCYRDMIAMNKISKVAGIIYVQCDPHTCSGRIEKRAREGESSIPIDYLQRLHEKHEQWLNPSIRPFGQETESSNHSSIEELASENSEKNQFDLYFLEDIFGESLQQDDHTLPKQQEKQKQVQQIKSDNMTVRPSQNPQNMLTLSTNKEKVLIIDNTIPIDKARIVRQIQNWLQTGF